MSALEIVAVPILANGEKLLRHFRSIDAPLKRYFIVDNSCGSDESVTNAIDEIWDTKPDHIDEVQVMTNTQNMGFAMSVNDIVRHNLDCKYWIVSNYDL
jgi:GT2 family glycosyltransferase